MGLLWREVECCDETEAKSVVWHLALCGDDDGDDDVYEQRKWFVREEM
jgi:hypothetical protein